MIKCGVLSGSVAEPCRAFFALRPPAAWVVEPGDVDLADARSLLDGSGLGCGGRVEGRADVVQVRVG